MNNRRSNTLSLVRQSDEFRYFGKRRLGILRKTILKPAELRHIILLRRCQFARNRVSLSVFRTLLFFSTRRTHIQIPYQTQIGRGFYIGHLGRVIIHPLTIIGKNVNLGTGVTLGYVSEGKYKGAPIIEDNVWIGTNAVIVGQVRIGRNTIIAPNSFVNRDVPEDSVIRPGLVTRSSRHQSMDTYLLNQVS